MFSPQNAMGSPRPGAGGGGIVTANNGNFSQAPNVFQGPLAYLEKTTSNIGQFGQQNIFRLSRTKSNRLFFIAFCFRY